MGPVGKLDTRSAATAAHGPSQGAHGLMAGPGPFTLDSLVRRIPLSVSVPRTASLGPQRNTAPTFNAATSQCDNPPPASVLTAAPFGGVNELCPQGPVRTPPLSRRWAKPQNKRKRRRVVMFRQGRNLRAPVRPVQWTARRQICHMQQEGRRHVQRQQHKFGPSWDRSTVPHGTESDISHG